MIVDVLTAVFMTVDFQTAVLMRIEVEPPFGAVTVKSCGPPFRAVTLKPSSANS